MASNGKRKLTAAQRAQIAKVKGETRAPAKPAPKQPSFTPMPAWVFWSGSILLLAMAGLSLNLSLSHLGYTTPGCGEGGSCDRLKQTVFAYVPGTYERVDGRISGWPVAYVGLAYFASLLIVWVMSGTTGINTLVRQVVRIGAVASLFYIIVMLFVVDGICPLCLATHLLNFALLGLVEFSTPKTRSFAGRCIGVGLAGLVVGTGGLLLVQESRSAELSALADAEGQRLIDDLAGAANAAGNGGDSDQRPAPVVTPAGFDLPRETHAGGREGFTGRYLIGPADAPIRIVTVSGYQCPSCQTVEAELKRLIEERDDVSLSLIHFPASSSCNPTLSRTNMHPAACRTAQIAEAAGILGGSDAFWAMSFKLFEYMSQSDSLGQAVRDVPEPTLDRWIGEFGMDTLEFRRVMASPEVAELIAGDSRLARSVGTNQTPMVFINGREFTGWNSQGALTRTVRGLGGQNLPRRTSTADAPPSSADRLIRIWRAASPVIPERSDRDWTRGAGDGSAARIVVWGCYDEENTQRADAIARDLVDRYPGASYEFRFYPFHNDCNPRTTPTRYTQACVKAKAAIAAGLLGGAEAHHRMHDWIMEQGENFRRDRLDEQFRSLGLDPDSALERMESPEVAQLIVADSNALQSLERHGIRSRPAVFVNERPTPWIFGTETIVLPDIVRAAIEGDGG